jgi:uncharacterized protein
MRIIDCHTHVFPDAIAPAAIASLEAEGDVSAVYDGTVTGLLATMDRAGVAASVIQPVATKPSQVCSINDWAASVAGERIIGFGAMHPDLDDPATEIARMHALGLQGIQDALRVPVCSHPTIRVSTRSGRRPRQHSDDRLLPRRCRHRRPDGAWDARKRSRRLLDRWPGLTVVLAHLGGFQQWEGVASLIAGRDVWLDTSYTLGHLPDEEFVEIVRAHGTDRVLFGSDGPWTDPGVEISRLRNLELTSAELEGHPRSERGAAVGQAGSPAVGTEGRPRSA